MQSLIKSITWLSFAPLVVVGCLDTAQAQNNTITASPTSLTFCVASSSSPAPAAQTITVSALPGQQQTSFNDNAFPSWIKVSPTATGNTQTNNIITVQIDPSGYNSVSAGTSQGGTVQISPSNGGNIVNVAVTLNVDPNCAAANTIAVTPTQLTFNSVSVGTTTSQMLTLNVTGPAVQASVDSNSAAWLTVSAPSGSSPQVITVTANPSSLTTAANYVGTITISQVGNASNSVKVPVSFPVGTSSTGSITWSPNPANFSVNSASTSPTNFTINLNGPNVASNVSLALDPGEPIGWLSVAPLGSLTTVPSTLSLTVNNPSVLTAGDTYGATITIAPQGGTSTQIRVLVSATASNYTLSPTSLTFQVMPGATSVSSQTVSLAGPTGSQITATAAINNGPALWLGVTPASGGANQNYTVTVNPANFTAGQSYSGSITFTQGSTAVATLPVTVNVGNTNTITIAPTQLNFLYQTGTNPPANQITQLLSITSPGNTNISYSASASYTSCANNWLVVSPSSAVTTGTIPETVTVSLNTAALLPSTTPATCLGTVTISAPSTGQTINIPVSVLVSNTPLMVATPSTLRFNYTPGGAAPSSQTISLASTNAATQLSYTYAVQPGVSGGPLFLTVTSSSTTSPSNTPGTLTVALDPTMLPNLAGGTYTDNIVVTSNSAGNPNVVIPVTLTVSNSSAFTANPSSLVFNYQYNAVPQPSQPSTTITLSSTGAPLQFNATAQTTSCGNFLLVNPASGSTSPSAGVNGVQIQVSTTGLSTQTSPVHCNGAITITSPSGAMLSIPVAVNVVNTPVINVGVSSITQTAPTGSTTSIPISVPLTSTDNNNTRISFNATAQTTPAGQSWLFVTPQTGGQTPINLSVVLNPTGLPAGTYTGAINITDLTLNTPVPSQTIPVTFTVATPLTVNPTSLTFNVNQGGSAPATQTITLTGVPQGVTISATPTTTNCGTNWITPTVSGGTITVGITPTGLTQSQSPCTGQISIVVPGYSPVNIPVTVNVAGALALSLSSNSASFTYVAGSSTTLPAQTVNVSATGGAAVPFTATAATTSGGNWLTVSPGTGMTGASPVPLTIGVSPTVLATLGIGTYQGTVTVASTSVPSGSMTINVTLMVTAAPPPAVLSIVNAATQLPGAIAPGEIVTIYGNNVGPATPTQGTSFTLSSNNTVPTTLSGTQVLFDNTPAPLLYVGPNQINAIVPYEVAGRLQTNITVARGSTSSSGILQVVAASSPGIFTQDASGRGLGSILNQDNSLNGPNHPAPKGSVISIFATGEGPTNPASVTGSVTTATPPYPKPIANVSANFLVQNPNGSVTQVPATISYAGEAPTLVAGVLQVNATIPSTVPSGPQSIVITVGQNSSPSTVTVWVQ